ncbi:MAG TPA: sialidase family protein [bacterium]|nr:sialidase family protein [bacterium]
MNVKREIFKDIDEKGRPVFPGFISYIDDKQPFLIHRYGRLDFPDGYDDFCDCFSYDNGKTWTEPVLKLKKYQQAGKHIRYVENACFFDKKRKKLFTFAAKRTYVENKIEVDGPSYVVYDIFDLETKTWLGEKEIKSDLPGDLFISFCFPVQMERNIILVPAITRFVDCNRTIIHYKGCWAPANQSLSILMYLRDRNNVEFIFGRPALIDLEKSSRGIGENTVAKLKNGNLVMVCRGDNSMFPEKPGYKWVCFSKNGGISWTDPEPFVCDDGTIYESSSTGSAIFRSKINGKLYWIGNLCIAGKRANGNWPRYPLVIVEVNEDPFCMKHSTISIIDTKAPDEPETLQLSNFRFYQDNENGDIVVFLTRFGERDQKNWKNAGYYRYRISLDD